MPQAPANLRDQWADDFAAHDHLRGKIVVTRAGIIHPREGVTLSELDHSAVDYLCLEWDYGYDSRPARPKPTASVAPR